MPTLIPLGDRIVVKRDKTSKETKTDGGIILLNNESGKPLEGVVVLSGPGRITDHGELIPNVVEKGQRVMFAKWTEYGDKENVIVREVDIIGIVL